MIRDFVRLLGILEEADVIPEEADVIPASFPHTHPSIPFTGAVCTSRVSSLEPLLSLIVFLAHP